MFTSTGVDQLKLAKVLLNMRVNKFPVHLELFFLVDLSLVVYNHWVCEILLRENEITFLVEPILWLFFLLLGLFFL